MATVMNNGIAQQREDTKPAGHSPEEIVGYVMSAIEKLEIDPIISRKAYRMRLDNIIESDEYNPNKRSSGRPWGRCTKDSWVNHIPEHCKPTCLMMVDDIFEMLESETGLDDTWGKPLRSRIIELFINIRQFNLDIDHFNKIRFYILKTLDSYGQVDLMQKVSDFKS